ncbi:MAG: dihydrofolate reductase [Gammaproteobacteria bacterium]|nr:dihydrofolate reductase [Gammaproteobacteria bacterium]
MPGRVSAEATPVELVVAAAEDGVIGRRNALPWHLPQDLKHFKALTLGCAVLMGRRTQDSIGRPLPDRLNLVLSRAPDYAPAGCTVVRSLEQARASAIAGRPLMVIGGGEIYRLCLPHARRIHLTLVHTRVEDGDTRFDEWRDPAWRETRRETYAGDSRHAHAYSFVTLDRS